MGPDTRKTLNRCLLNKEMIQWVELPHLSLLRVDCRFFFFTIYYLCVWSEVRHFFSLSISSLFQINTVLKVKVVVTQLYLALCDHMDCSPPDSSVHGILQARILKWVAVMFSRGSSRPRLNSGLLRCRRILYCLSYQGLGYVYSNPQVWFSPRNS